MVPVVVVFEFRPPAGFVVPEATSGPGYRESPYFGRLYPPWPLIHCQPPGQRPSLVSIPASFLAEPSEPSEPRDKAPYHLATHSVDPLSSRCSHVFLLAEHNFTFISRRLPVVLLIYILHHICSNPCSSRIFFQSWSRVPIVTNPGGREDWFRSRPTTTLFLISLTNHKHSPLTFNGLLTYN